MVLFRPVGPHELALIEVGGWTAFPPRLYGQPIFYPVLNEQYATDITRDWNSTDERQNYLGYVVRFEVDDDYGQQFERRIVGSRVAEELWVPAEQLDEFNNHIVGKIEVVSKYSRGARVSLTTP